MRRDNLLIPRFPVEIATLQGRLQVPACQSRIALAVSGQVLSISVSNSIIIRRRVELALLRTTLTTNIVQQAWNTNGAVWFSRRVKATTLTLGNDGDMDAKIPIEMSAEQWDEAAKPAAK